MTAMKYSVSQWIYGREPLERGLERLRRYGYDGVELAGEPDEADPSHVRSLLERYGLEASSVCGIYNTPERDLSHEEEGMRRTAVRYVAACAELAASTGARLVIVVPSPVGKLSASTEPERSLELAAQSIRQAAERAGERGVSLCIEALNRYESYLVNTLEQATRLARMVDLPNVGIMADTFHMNIEEASLPSSIREYGDLICHVHLADSNRRAVGMGHISFDKVADALADVGYPGWYTMEFLPPVSNPYDAAGQAMREELLDEYTLESIQAMKQILGG